MSYLSRLGIASRFLRRSTETKYSSLFDGNVKIGTAASAEEKTFVLKWTPGYWKRSVEDNKEVNKLVLEKIKSGELTVREALSLGYLGLEMGVIFVIAGMVGKRKIFGYHFDEDHLYDERRIH